MQAGKCTSRNHGGSAEGEARAGEEGSGGEIMWPYFGNKRSIIKLYPGPGYSKIIEPFAGAANYALRYYDHDILLMEKNETVITIWKWLQQCSIKDIESLPRLKQGQKLTDFSLSSEAKSLMGFLIAPCVEAPRNTASYYCTTFRPNRINYQIHYIAQNLFKIKHWEIRLGDYRDLPNEESTWFIDPPYQFGGEAYPNGNSSLNYSELAEWCRHRSGQVIVCENTAAAWLPFKPMRRKRGLKHTTTEAIWSNCPTQWDYQQAVML